MTHGSIHNNESEWVIRGQFDINSSAAVTASRGSNATVTKTATGTYTVVLPGALGLPLVELLQATATYSSTVPATALGVRVSSVAQATDGTITITVKTMASATSGADTDGTAATTINYDVVIRVNKMGNPL